MVAPSVGSVVVVGFPFSDLSASKRRPAIILAAAGRNDWILCQITSKPYGDPLAIQIINADFESGSLSHISYARPGKLFTANVSLMRSEIGRLVPGSHDKIRTAIISLLNAKS